MSRSSPSFCSACVNCGHPLPAGAFSDLCQNCQLPEIEIAKARANVDALMEVYRQLYELLPKLQSGKAFKNIALAGMASLIIEETKQNVV